MPNQSPIHVARIARAAPVGPASDLLADALADDDLGCVVSPGTRRMRVNADTAVVLVAVSPPVPVDGELVDALVDVLHNRGWADVCVGATLRTFDRDRGYHDVAELLRDARVSGRTAAGTVYKVVDMGRLTVTSTAPDTSVLTDDRSPPSVPMPACESQSPGA
jgi:hypothetical protein